MFCARPTDDIHERYTTAVDSAYIFPTQLKLQNYKNTKLQKLQNYKITNKITKLQKLITVKSLKSKLQNSNSIKITQLQK